MNKNNKIQGMQQIPQRKREHEKFVKTVNFFHSSKNKKESQKQLMNSNYRKSDNKWNNTQSQRKKSQTIMPYIEQDKSTRTSNNFVNSKFSASVQKYNHKNSSRELTQRRSQDAKLASMKIYRHLKQSRMKSLKKQKRTISGDVYQNQLCCLMTIYQLLCNILSAMKNDGQEYQQRMIAEYVQFIKAAKMQFIDEFVEQECDRIKKLVKLSRVNQYLSMPYIFLQIAQGRIYSNQSYLINFVQFCISNLIFIAKIYVFLQRKQEFPFYEFERQMNQYQIQTYGTVLTNVDDLLYRIQHNNQIITLIHRKLGKYNEKFQEYTSSFLKKAERRKYSTTICAHYIFECLAMYIHETQLTGISPQLQVSPTPYLAQQRHEYTLVFEPLGIMMNSNQMLRPYLMHFFDWASQYFDLVLWTWEMPKEVQDIVELLQPFLFSKLYRYHCVIKNQVYTKNINRLGRDIKKVVIIDYDEKIFAETPTNGFVARWKGEAKDRGLLIIAQMLQEMLERETSVNDMLNFYASETESIRGGESKESKESKQNSVL